MGTTPLNARSLTLTVGGAEYTGEVSGLRIVTAESSDRPLVAGPYDEIDYVLAATAVQDVADLSSLWRAAWERGGERADVVIYPYEDRGVFIQGEVFIKAVVGDAFGGDANPRPSGRFTFDLEWPFTGRPQINDPVATPLGEG